MIKTINITYLAGHTIILAIGRSTRMKVPSLDPAGETFMINGQPACPEIGGAAPTVMGKIDAPLLIQDQHGDHPDTADKELLKAIHKTFTTRIGTEKLEDYAIGSLWIFKQRSTGVCRKQDRRVPGC